jgi:hypothetical protein
MTAVRRKSTAGRSFHGLAGPAKPSNATCTMVRDRDPYRNLLPQIVHEAATGARHRYWYQQ